MTDSPAKSPAKKRSSSGKPKKVASHPTYAQMIKMAVQNLKERNGSSKAAILKYILSHYKVGDNVKQINAHLRMAINRGVSSGVLKQTKGHGASGSFRLGDKAEKKPKAAKKPAAKKKAPKKASGDAPAKKVKKSPKKKPAAKKAKASPKKPKAAKKSPAKKAAKKSPAKKKSSPKKKAAKK